MFADAPPTVAHVDLPRYSGHWYQIARLPSRLQPEDCTDATVEYSPGDDGDLRVCARWLLPDGRVREAHGHARAVDGCHARLQMSFMPAALRWLPFTTTHYWILLLDDACTLSLAGTPNRRGLWLLSRTRHPPPAMRDGFLARAEAMGYDLTPLIHTQHHPRTRKAGFGATPGPRAGHRNALHR